MTEALTYMIDFDMLAKSFRMAKRQSVWKRRTQLVDCNLFSFIVNLQKRINEHTYHILTKTSFYLNERGKIRLIQPLDITDMIIQRSLCDNILLPRIMPKLIYDNGASLPGKGISFSRKRFELHLSKVLKKNNFKSDNVYVMFGDFSKFFDNIDHNLLKDMYRSVIPEDDVYELICMCIDHFTSDVSYMTDAEYEMNYTGVFDSSKHHENLKSYTGPKNVKMMHKGLGIGAQLSQVSAIFYPSCFDHFCKTVLGIKYYGRYMDDFYIISDDLNYLKSLRPLLTYQASLLKLTLNDKKFRIDKLSKGVTFLKTKYYIKGKKIIKRINPNIITRERRKIKKYHKMYLNHEITLDDICNQYKSWKGIYDTGEFANKKSLYNIRKLFSETFAYLLNDKNVSRKDKRKLRTLILKKYIH